jgi:hypothetical protein
MKFFHHASQLVMLLCDKYKCSIGLRFRKLALQVGKIFYTESPGKPADPTQSAIADDRK